MEKDGEICYEILREGRHIGYLQPHFFISNVMQKQFANTIVNL